MTTPTVIAMLLSSPGLTEERLRGRLGLLSGAGAAGRAIAWLDVRDTNEDLCERAFSAVDGLLSDISLQQQPDTQRAHIRLLFVVDLEDAESLHRARACADAVQRLFQDRLRDLIRAATLECSILCLMRRPLQDAASGSGPAPYAPQYAWLREAYGRASLERVILLTPGNHDAQYNPNGFPRLAPEQVDDLALEFLVQAATTDLLARADELIGASVRPPVLYSTGIASIVLSGNSVIEQRGGDISAEIIDRHSKGAAAATDQQVAGFVSDHGLSTEDLLDDLVQVGTPGETVISRLAFEPFVLRAVGLDDVPERMASYGDYLAHEKIRWIFQQIDRNREAAKRQALSDLSARVDGIVAGEPDPSAQRALDFLRRLYLKARQDRDQADTLFSEERLRARYEPNAPPKPSVRLPDEMECHDRLVKALENRLMWLPVLTRFGLLGLVCGFLVRVISTALTGDPSWRRMGVGGHPGPWFAGVWVVFFAWGALSVLQDRRIIKRRIGDYERAILRRLRASVYRYLQHGVHAIYDALLGRIGDPGAETADAGSERRAVLDFCGFSELAARALRERPAGFPSTLFLLDAFDYLDPALTFPYWEKPEVAWDEVAWDEEMRECAGRGLFCPWRAITGAEGDEARAAYGTSLQRYAEEGFQYIARSRSLLQYLEQHPRVPPERLWATLQDRSHIFLALRRQVQAPLQFLSYAHVDAARLEALFRPEGDPVRLEDAERFRLGVCHLAWGFPAKDVPLIHRWRRDYMSCAEKAALHRLPDWEHLPDPICGPDEPKDGGENGRDGTEHNPIF